MRIMFNQQVSLGSILTMVVIILCTFVGAYFYVSMERNVIDAGRVQKENRQKIEQIAADFANYRDITRDHALFLTKQLGLLSAEIDQLKRQLDARAPDGN